MTNLLISYSPRNTIAAKAVDLLSNINGVKLHTGEILLSSIELKELEDSEKSGYVSEEVIMEKLRK